VFEVDMERGGERRGSSPLPRDTKLGTESTLEHLLPAIHQAMAGCIHFVQNIKMTF